MNRSRIVLNTEAQRGKAVTITQGQKNRRAAMAAEICNRSLFSAIVQAVRKPRGFSTTDYANYADFLYPWHPCDPWSIPPLVAALPRCRSGPARRVAAGLWFELGGQ
jgi:hypothetical protein